MTETIQKKLNSSRVARWSALIIVSFTMMCAYFVTDVMAPLEDMLTLSRAEGGLGWTSTEYGFFSGAYGYINVFLLMLFFGGLILDKCGVRFTGVMATGFMVAGAALKWFAVSPFYTSEAIWFGYHSQVILASLGFAIYGMGAEIAGITVTKIIAKWFTGYELALAMGLQVALARIGTAMALGFSLPVAQSMPALGPVSGAVLVGVIGLFAGFISFMVFCVMDKKLDTSIAMAKEMDKSEDSENAEETAEAEEGFKFSDLKLIVTNKGFWLITILCLLFYSGVFPFLKFATKLMIYKYSVDPDWAGKIPMLLPFGTILLTPLFGSIYDKRGKGATLMVIGSIMLAIVHILFAVPFITSAWFAIVVMLILGVAFSLVPSAMWPSVPKIIPQKQLGSAYAIIFYIQNIGLSMVPVLIGRVIDNYATKTTPTGVVYDYTLPMSIFALFGVASFFVALYLKSTDRKNKYGLEEPNIEEKENAESK